MHQNVDTMESVVESKVSGDLGWKHLDGPTEAINENFVEPWSQGDNFVQWTFVSIDLFVCMFVLPVNKMFCKIIF